MTTYKQLNPNDTASFGTKGIQVENLQKTLNSMGANLKVDSLFGPETQRAYNKLFVAPEQNTEKTNTNTNPVTETKTIGETFQIPTTEPTFKDNPLYTQSVDILSGKDTVDESAFRSKAIADAQDRINAINQVYASKLAEARQQGVGRIGQTTAILANRGLAGSIRGGAIGEETLATNRRIEGAIDDERLMNISAVLGEAEKAGALKAQQRREALQSGAKNYIEFIKAEDEINKKNIDSVASAFLFQGIDPTTLSEQELKTISDKISANPSDIISLYKQKKFEKDEEAKKLDKEKRYVSIGDGDQLYDTQTGEIVASNEKNFAPKATGGGSGTGASGTGSNKYTSDLEAIIGNTIVTLPKFAQQEFQRQLQKTRNDADKISLVASVVLKNVPGEIKTDFANQSIGVSNIDKALAEIDKNAKTGFINSKLQKGFNLFGKDYDPSLTTIASYITAAVQPYRASVTGAAWGEQEEAEYQQLFGSVLYSPEELKQRLITLKEIMKDKSAQGLNVFINPMNTYANPFVQNTQNTVAPITPSNTVTVYTIKTGKAATIPAAQLQSALSSGLFRQ
jgi:hypothetical protein